MKKNIYFRFGKKSITLCSIFITLLFVSSATAVPQVNGSLAIEKLDEINHSKIMFDFVLENIDIQDIESEKSKINSLFILSKIIKYEIGMIDDSYININQLDDASNKIKNDEIDEKELIIETKNCITSLSDTINIVQENNDFTLEEYKSIELLKGMILRIGSVFINKFYNNDGIIKDNTALQENGILRNIISLILTVLQFIVTILKAILQGFFTLFGGLIRTIGAIVGIIVLILADIQTILLLSGLYLISLGVLSKNIIKTLASIGAPIFAAITAFLSIAIGSLLGSITAVLFSILGVLIILAIPIALVAAYLYFTGYFDGGDGDGLLYIIASCIAYYMKSI
jgi:hypothetical protein